VRKGQCSYLPGEKEPACDLKFAAFWGSRSISGGFSKALIPDPDPIGGAEIPESWRRRWTAAHDRGEAV